MSVKDPKNIVPADGLYRTRTQKGTNKKNLGFDYHAEDIIVKKTMMPRLFLNENVKGFLSHINDIFVNSIDSVKIIRTFFNYTVKKDDTSVN